MYLAYFSIILQVLAGSSKFFAHFRKFKHILAFSMVDKISKGVSTFCHV